MNLSRFKIFVKEFFGGSLLFSREGIEFPDFRNEGFFEIDFIMIEMGRRKFSSTRFFKYFGELKVFWRKDGFQFGEFHLYG